MPSAAFTGLCQGKANELTPKRTTEGPPKLCPLNERFVGKSHAGMRPGREIDVCVVFPLSGQMEWTREHL